jgi:hypothetical protein
MTRAGRRRSYDGSQVHSQSRWRTRLATCALLAALVVRVAGEPLRMPRAACALPRPSLPPRHPALARRGVTRSRGRRRSFRATPTCLVSWKACDRRAARTRRQSAVSRSPGRCGSAGGLGKVKARITGSRSEPAGVAVEGLRWGRGDWGRGEGRVWTMTDVSSRIQFPQLVGGEAVISEEGGARPRA